MASGLGQIGPFQSPKAQDGVYTPTIALLPPENAPREKNDLINLKKAEIAFSRHLKPFGPLSSFFYWPHVQYHQNILSLFPLSPNILSRFFIIYFVWTFSKCYHQFGDNTMP